MDIEVVDARIAKNHIKPALKRLNLAQEEAARRVGVSYRHFNRVVLGHAEPTLVVAAKMAIVLGTSVDHLFEIKIKTRSRNGHGAR
jgi:DNA-binding XRE family transcriptional regulator